MCKRLKVGKVGNRPSLIPFVRFEYNAFDIAIFSYCESSGYGSIFEIEIVIVSTIDR